MATIRVAKRRQFTTIDRRAITDSRLSFRARGVLAWLLSMPDDWRVDSRVIAREGLEGRDAVRTALRELKAAGYMVVQKTRTEGGQWATETFVYESRQPVDK